MVHSFLVPSRQKILKKTILQYFDPVTSGPGANAQTLKNRGARKEEADLRKPEESFHSSFCEFGMNTQINSYVILTGSCITNGVARAMHLNKY